AGGSFATVSTLAADLGHTAVFPALAGGGTLHVVPVETASDAGRLEAYLREHGVECLKMVPSHLRALLAAAPGARVVPSARLVFGGEALHRDLVDAVASLGPGCRIDNHYGPSETTEGVLTHQVASGGAGAATVPLGRPLPGVRAYVLDRALEPVPFWLPGELVLAGATVSRGYLGRPAATAERFVPDPLGAEPGGRAYRSGDLVRRLGDGAIEFLGRIDHQIKFHGFRVEPEELRRAVNRHPEVHDSHVVLHREGNGDGVLVAYYTAARPLESGSLRRAAAEAVPDEVLPNLFVYLPELPRRANGKVDAGALPPPAEARRAGPRSRRPPRTPAEELVAGVWAELLGLERVGADDHFFELGGHSLLATQAVSRLRRLFGSEVGIRALFEEPTVAGLARRLERSGRAAYPAGPALEPLPARERRGGLPLSFAQERIWATQQLDPGDTAYNSARAYRFTGGLDIPALAAALGDVVRRHEALRTTFASVEGRAVQVVHDRLPAAVGAIDLSGLDAARRDRATADLVRLGPATPLDLERGPLLRALLLLQGSGEAVAVFTLHHIAGDAWSRGIFIRELAACYRARTAGTAPDLAALPIQYTDFAVWQRRWLEGGGAEHELAYWRRRLRGAPESIGLPTDRPHPTHRSSRGDAVRRALPASLARSVAEVSRTEGATPFMTLLAAFYVLLRRLTGSEDLVVGTDVANRCRPVLEGILGLFVNHVVLRANLSGDPPFRELLRRVRASTLEAYAHQELPFDRLVKELRPQRDPARTPLFQILFVLQNVPLGDLELAGVQVTPVEVPSERTKFDLAVFVEERSGTLEVAWSYRSDLFRRERIEALAAAFECLLERACRAPGEALSALEAERP
ncbi:MAG TPA: condensation domain-containing protein, partial [Thermoanaerobaculia bacterium]|nr:condensation domain-containing protein [Thermoanaerobaculia bacterium]